MLIGWLAAFAFILLLAFSLYCFGYAAKRSAILFVLTLQVTTSAVAIFLLLYFVEDLTVQQVFDKPSGNNWLWLSSAALFGIVAGNYFAYLNLRTAGEKINSLLSPAITAIAIVLGFFILEEKLHAVQWAGALITIITISYFLLNSSNQGGNFQISKVGAWSGILTILLLSFSIMGAVKGSAGISIFHAVWIQMVVAAGILLPVFLFVIRKNWWQQGFKFYMSVLAGLIAQNILAAYLWYYASFKIGVSIFQIWIATLPLFVYAIDVYLLKKSKPSMLFIASSILALAGISLVMLS